MDNIEINIVNNSVNDLPKYETDGSAGMDLRASLENSIILKSLERRLVPTGIYLEIPVGYEAQVRPRSGLAYKQGITVLNSPGTIDSDYRGEVKVILINLSSSDQVISNGERIAQIIISKVEKAILQPVQQLSASKREQGGFGHTGKF